jgi:protein TonB
MRLSRSAFAVGIVGAHLLLAYFLVTPLRRFTRAISGAGEAMVVLPPSEVHETRLADEAPPPVEPELEEPDVVWVPTEPSIVIRESDGSSRQAIVAMPLPASEAGIAVLQRVMPHYPIESVRAGEEGSAVLQVLVDESGRASEVRVARSSGSQRLDDSAVSAVRMWRFAPGRKEWGELELRFDLYRFTLSRIIDQPLDLLPLGEILDGGSKPALPGGAAALRGLMSEVESANPDVFDAPWIRDELRRMKEAFAGWGKPTLIQHQGAAAGGRWRAYEIRPEFRNLSGRPTVSLRWEVYQVTHENGVSQWRIALDSGGRIWAAHASAVRR